jgi:ribosome maturation protein SDO1
MATQGIHIPTREQTKVNLVRLKKGGEVFEVVLKDPDKALEYRHGLDVDVRDVLEIDNIFKDAKRGEFASENKLKELFGTADTSAIAKIILQEGEYHLTAEQKRKLIDNKKKQILQYIHENAADPKTKLPHPIQRLELAWDQAKVRIDPHTPAKAQVDKVVKSLSNIIPISFEFVKIRVTIPARYAASAYAQLKGKFNLKNDSWKNDGSVIFELEAPAKVKAEAYDRINKLTNGEAMIEELER